MRIIDTVDDHHTSRLGYGTIIRLMQFAVIAGYVAGIIYAAIEL